MKIDNSLKPVSTTTSDTKLRVNRETSVAPASPGDAKVELSARLGQLEQAIRNSPVVDTAKVEEIKQAIAEGRFKVDPDKVADGLLDSVRQMLASQPRIA